MKLFIALAILIASASSEARTVKFVEGSLIVRLAPNVKPNAFSRSFSSDMFEIERALVPELNIYLVKLKGEVKVSQALNIFSRSSMVVYAQPDHYTSLRSKTPTDPDFTRQWPLLNANKADISAIAAWDLGTGGRDRAGNDVVIAVVDGGMDTTHPDLVPNLWINPGETAGNGVDDDNNGKIDDVNGWNVYGKNGNIPKDAHGTHVSGIAGASGDNGKNIAGVNWNVKLMAVAAASGTTSVIVEGYGYVLAQKKLWLSTKGKLGANVVSTNSSFGVDYADCKTGEFPIWNDLYEEMGKVGILSAIATANNNVDVDAEGDVPTGCGSEYIVSVTSTNSLDKKSSFAGYGRNAIDIGAPGENVLSTVPYSKVGLMSGTSMATPHVAGAIAFLHSVASEGLHTTTSADPAAAALAIKKLMLENVDVTEDLKDKTVSGGRLNLYKSALAASKY